MVLDQGRVALSGRRRGASAHLERGTSRVEDTGDPTVDDERAAGSEPGHIVFDRVPVRRTEPVRTSRPPIAAFGNAATVDPENRLRVRPGIRAIPARSWARATPLFSLDRRACISDVAPIILDECVVSSTTRARENYRTLKSTLLCRIIFRAGHPCPRRKGRIL
ncbi:hypothetical protein LOK46_29880 (plasmid) [Methylobacterium sp. NMS14P]|uniref:hypothetical protein n=1 Tax=Methylobacterium sp. NMS14P TaxID=2894310 RepID=UPI00235A4309|nr:hypothetical protein [Methylobacterium sp. NMS14P]WCS28606.1 hypothetical protein LOK46_29880 [Methylobacterium sp. NMS14P]